MEKKKQINVYLDKELHKKLKIHCIKQEILIKDFLENLVKEALE